MGKVTVNGVTYEVPDGSTVSIVDGNVIIDGKSGGKVESQLEIKVDGALLNLKVERGNVTVNGDVKGTVDCGGSVECGNISGDVDAGGSVKCGHISGDVDAGGSVKCGYISGGVRM